MKITPFANSTLNSEMNTRFLGFFFFFFFQNHAVFRQLQGKPPILRKFWAQGPPGVKTPLAPLIKIPDPRLQALTFMAQSHLSMSAKWTRGQFQSCTHWIFTIRIMRRKFGSWIKWEVKLLDTLSNQVKVKDLRRGRPNLTCKLSFYHSPNKNISGHEFTWSIFGPFSNQDENWIFGTGRGCWCQLRGKLGVSVN